MRDSGLGKRNAECGMRNAGTFSEHTGSRFRHVLEETRILDAGMKGGRSLRITMSRLADPNPQSRVPSPGLRSLLTRAIGIALGIAIATAAPVGAKIAVFVDGRILKVDDAYLQDDRIVLELKGGGRMVVSAIRIDRVVADEVEEAPEPLPWASCPSGWSSDPLPDWVPFRESIQAAAQAADVHPWLLAALVQAESAFEPGDDNLRGGANHLRRMLDRFEALPLALAAYNAGAATVERYDGIPPYRETRGYVRRILERFCPES